MIDAASVVPPPITAMMMYGTSRTASTAKITVPDYYRTNAAVAKHLDRDEPYRLPSAHKRVPITSSVIGMISADDEAITEGDDAVGKGVAGSAEDGKRRHVRRVRRVRARTPSARAIARPKEEIFGVFRRLRSKRKKTADILAHDGEYRQKLRRTESW